jgi:serine/threonine protein kinase
MYVMIHTYNIGDKIGEGSFGIVFKGKHMRTLEPVAIKMEYKRPGIVQTLKNEAKIYQYLGKSDGFPLLKWFGTTKEYNYLVTDLLGKSLTDVVTYYKALPLKNVLILGIQIFQRIELLHEHSLLHRDIKPDNFLFSLDKTNKLHLIDFGFCKRYTFNGRHILEKKLTNIVGSVNFVSLNIHNYIEPSRRDDVASCIYILLYMYLGDLEWFHLPLDTVFTLKSELTKLDEVPTFIKQMLEYSYTLKFEDKPDYRFLISLLTSEFERQ